jgi:hypothetical protein
MDVVPLPPPDVGSDLALPPPGMPEPEAVPVAAPSLSSAAPAPIIRGPPMSGAEVGVSVEAPPAPDEAGALAAYPPLPPPPLDEIRPAYNKSGSRVEQALAKVPSMPQMPAVPAMPRLNATEKAKKFFKELPGWYCDGLARFPWAFLLFYLMIIVIVLSAGWRSLEVDTDVEAFREVVGNASKYQRSYTEALKHQKESKDAQALTDRTTFELQLYYKTKSGDVFSEAALRDIRRLEGQLRKLDGWKRMCAMSDPAARFRCEPGESLGNYAWPLRDELDEENHIPFTLAFEGGSRERLPVDAFLTYLEEGKANPHELSKFLPHHFSGPADSSSTLRSIFAFTAPSLNDEEFRKEYEAFVADELFLELKNSTETAEEDPDDEWVEPWSIRLYFRGEEIEAHEVRYYLEGDLALAIGALVFTFLCIWLQLRSYFLAVCGLGQVCLVPFVAFVTVQIDEVSLATFVSVFLVIGLSSNDLIAVKEYWMRIGRELPLPANTGGIGSKLEVSNYYSKRISRTFQAVFFRFLPQFIFIISWLGLLLSLIRPIREFGLFMFVCTAYSCIVCVAMFPPLLILHDSYVKPFIVNRMPRIISIILEPEMLKFPWRPIARQCLKLAVPEKARIVWAVTAFITLILFIITAVVASNSDSPGLPEVYSPSHHGNAGREIVNTFMPTEPANAPPQQLATVCELSPKNGVVVCPTAEPGLHWCEAPQAEIASGDTSTTTTSAPGSRSKCVCHRPTLPSAEYINHSMVLTGHMFTSLNDSARETSVRSYMNEAFTNASFKFEEGKARHLSSLVLEHWESGVTDVEPVVEMPGMLIGQNQASVDLATSANTAYLRTTCYCGQRVCTNAEGVYTMGEGIILPEAATASLGLGNSRRLVDADRPYGRSLSESASIVKEINIVFGILPADSDGFLKGQDAYTMDSDYEPSSPWAQRAMLAMCNDIPGSLEVQETHCWIQQFRTWQLAKGNKFLLIDSKIFRRPCSGFFVRNPAFRSLQCGSTQLMIWLRLHSPLRSLRRLRRMHPRSLRTETAG